MLLMLLLVTCVKHDTVTSNETAIPAAIECGFKPGDIACDFTLFDQDDNKVSLYDFKGKTILLDFSTVWCYWCNVAAMYEVELVNLYKDNGFEWVTVLVENKNGKRPSCSDLKAWVDKYSIESPVLSGKKEELLDLKDDGVDAGYRCGGFPTFVIINKDMQIVEYIYGWGEDLIKKRIEEALNEDAV